jgi:hypothetical protein
MEYKISHSPPPCYEEAKKKFGVNFFRDRVVFTYGDTIHFYKGNIDPDLIAHESVHIKQHAAYSGGPEAWWRKYLDDGDFRLSQELEAYRAQYEYILKYYKKKTHFDHLHFYAKSLCTIYGLKMTIEDAMNLISNYEKI